MESCILDDSHEGHAHCLFDDLNSVALVLGDCFELAEAFAGINKGTASAGNDALSNGCPGSTEGVINSIFRLSDLNF